MAKRSIHEASKVEPTCPMGALPTPHEPKLDHGRSHLAAGQVW
jgi:hypothetical protein